MFHRLVEQKDGWIHEAHLASDHVHMYVSIPPKYTVAQSVVTIHFARTYGGKARNYAGEHFRARGYLVSTKGRDEQVI